MIVASLLYAPLTIIWIFFTVENGGLYKRTSARLHSFLGRFSRQNSSIEDSKFSAKSDSAIFLDEDVLPNSFSRSSSVATSACSCRECLKKDAGEWVRRPSRLLENCKVDDYYQFDAILGNYLHLNFVPHNTSHYTCMAILLYKEAFLNRFSII